MHRQIGRPPLLQIAATAARKNGAGAIKKQRIRWSSQQQYSRPRRVQIGSSSAAGGMQRYVKGAAKAHMGCRFHGFE